MLGSSSCGLLNSVNISTRYSIPVENYNEVNYEEEKISQKNFFKVPSISVKNVSHPSFYKKWDFDKKISPSLHFEKHSLTTNTKRYNPKTNSLEKYPKLKIYRFSALMNSKIFAHTPVGAFYLVVGPGATIYKADDGETINTIKGTDILKYEVSYVGFFKKRFYINLSARLFDSHLSMASAAVKIGYYFSDVNKETVVKNK